MHSLNTRLVMSAGVWIMLVLIVGGFALSFVFQQSAETSFRRQLENTVNALIAITDVDEGRGLTVARSLGDPRFEQALSGWYWQVSSDGAPLARSRSLWDASLSLSAMTDASTPAPGEFGITTLQGPRGRTLWASYRMLRIEGFPSPVRFMVAGDIADLIQDRQRFDFILILSLVALGLGVLLALVMQVRFGLKPLRGLVHDMEAILQRRANRLDKKYPAEIMPLIHVANAVLEENQNQISRARRHVGNLAHALKTPLTLLRGEIRPDGDTSHQKKMNQQIDTISNLLEHHLARAATAGASSFSMDTVSVFDTVTSICQSLEKIHAEENRQGYIDIPVSLTFRGEREDLEEIIGNVVENAFKWAKSSIYVRARAEADGLHLLVQDDGPGMADEEMQASLDRGKRLDEMTPGHGLGLSIVSDLVELYGGRLTLGSAPMGGLSVSIVFPLSRIA